MRVLKRFGVSLALAVVVAVIVREWSPVPIALGLVGAVLGLLLELASFQAGTLLGAFVFRLRVRHVVFGIGRELWAWATPRTRIVLCGLPLVIQVGVRSLRPPVRRWLWLAGATSVLVAVLAAAAAWILAGGPLGRGLALGMTACLVHQLVPRRGAQGTSPGWFLFKLPGVTGRQAAEMDATPLVNDVTDAVRAGQLDAADTALARLVEQHPTLLMTVGAQVVLLSVRARYAEALHLVSSMVGRTDLEPRDLAFVLAEMAGSAANAMEAGQMPMDVGMPAAARAADSAMQLGLPRHRLAGTLAQLALLRDDTAAAVELARQSADGSEGVLARADALATLARAQMASGDNAAARVTIAEAESLSGWLPRVVETTARLNIG